MYQAVHTKFQHTHAMIFNKKTKWIVLGNYSYGYTDYVVFVRKSLKTGLLDFKVKSVHPHTTFRGAGNILAKDLINVTEQWNKIINND